MLQQLKLETYVKPGETLIGFYYKNSKSNFQTDFRSKRECKWWVILDWEIFVVFY